MAILPAQPRSPSSVLQRFFYTFTMYLLTPVILYRLAARGLRYPDYFERWRERFGFFPDPGLHDSIWVHAVSVGEVNAAVPLIEALMQRYRNVPLVITTVTPTGSERVQKLFGERVFHVYLPYDLTASVERFLDRVRPRLAVVMETEIWPNLFMTCNERGIPIVVANARLSERSLRGYGPVRPLARRAIRCASFVAAQSPSDAERLRALGTPAARLAVVGNLKFDMALPAGVHERGAEYRAAWGNERPVWIAASTHEGEEFAVLKAHTAVLRRFPDALLLVAPRHPERFRPIATSCRALGFRTATRSENQRPDPACQCFVIDTMGELLTFYAGADVAFVGGSLVPVGGHNLLEPAALMKPVIVGPHTFNFAEITEGLITAYAAQRIADADALGPAIVRLLAREQERHSMGEAARTVMECERGAVERTMTIIERVLGEERPAASPRTKTHRAQQSR
ncbi:MAG TPA: lipid IV(A) 3-deoxy-D-manno-octulosonic acid transferase [Rhodanobacteraceae bacterium]|nr:lipid IV(A) 3-deoxy-D-manno-octulosonic acid transferase [Rhodanobacteraceae bacterium]